MAPTACKAQIASQGGSLSQAFLSGLVLSHVFSSSKQIQTLAGMEPPAAYLRPPL